MKTKIIRIETHEVEADLPNDCPECGADFTKPGALLEDTWAATEAGCYLDVSDVTYDGQSETLDISSLITGYRCRCGKVIVTTEDATHPVADVQS